MDEFDYQYKIILIQAAALLICSILFFRIYKHLGELWKLIDLYKELIQTYESRFQVFEEFRETSNRLIDGKSNEIELLRKYIENSENSNSNQDFSTNEERVNKDDDNKNTPYSSVGSDSGITSDS